MPAYIKNPGLHWIQISAVEQLEQLEQVLQIPLTLKYWEGHVDELQSFPYNTLLLMQDVQFVAEF